jgi:hypothetical protein
MTFGTSIAFAANKVRASALTLNRIREGNYSSEFYARESEGNYRVHISHLKEKNTGLERHLYKVGLEVKATDAVPAHVVEAYVVLRTRPDTAVSQIQGLVKGIVEQLTDANVSKLAQWQS